MQRVPDRLFEDTDKWTISAKQKLDKFEENLDKPNFINYDLLEQKDSGQMDVIQFGEQLVTELDEHKDVSMSRLANQIKQLGIGFNHETIGKLSQVVHCEAIDGVVIDEAELASMEEMMREAAEEPVQMNLMSSRTNTSNMTDAPLTRNSIVNMAGDENDLLAESTVF